MRAELLRRLGPSAYDANEMESFTGSGGLAYMDMRPKSAIEAVREYAPYFRMLAIELKRKAVPLAAPTALAFTEARIASNSPEFVYRLLVTIESRNEFTSGYIVVQFEGKPGEILADLPDSKPVLGGEDVYDNPELMSQLIWNSTTTTYALRIGKTPFGDGRVLHVIAFAVKDVHVVRVLFFDE